MAARPMKRLNFHLPELTRRAWVSDEARAVWEPRIQDISHRWSEITWRSIPMGLRACAVVHISADALDAESQRWAEIGLSGVVLPTLHHRSQDHVEMRVAVGSLDAARQLKRYRDAGDHDGVGALLGFPSCCRRFFRRVWVKEQFIDTTWAMASNSVRRPGGTSLEVSGYPACNILHRWIGVRAVQHLPCSFECEPTARLGEQFLTAARQTGFVQEVEWIEEILSWPAEWSTLHGIAEIRSPVLKVVTNSDATRGKYTVRWQGTAYPQEGVAGLQFPYRRPGQGDLGVQPQTRSALLATEAPPQTVSRYSSETQNPVSTPGPSPRTALRAASAKSWRYTDNGFSSLRRMHEAHRPIVNLARRRLVKSKGAILDLGCGNGILLQKICARRGGLIPYGIDKSSDAIARAKLIAPSFAANFYVNDMFASITWLAESRFELAMLMLGRLTEVPRAAADRMMEVLRANCERILVYVYPGAETDLTECATKIELELEEVQGYVGMLRLPQRVHP